MKSLKTSTAFALVFAICLAGVAQDGCVKEAVLQTEVGERYELGQQISVALGELPIIHPGAKYLRALLTINGALSCDWAVIVRDRKYRAIEVYSAHSFTNGRRWTHRIQGDVMYLDLSPCEDGRAPAITVQSYIEMPLTAKNPYYSFQDPNKPLNVKLFEGVVRDPTRHPIPNGIRRLGDNVAFVMASYSRTSWVCSGVMVRPGLLLTNWHCGVVYPIEVDHYWNSEVIQDVFADISWDGDDLSREYTAVKLLAGSSSLDYALLEMSAVDPGDVVVPVTVASNELSPNEPLYLVHHTEGLPKQLSACKVDALVYAASSYAPGAEFEHSCDSEKGSSGSPMFDEAGQLVGIHHAGFRQDAKCMSLDKENKAIRISYILADLKDHHSDVYNEYFR